MGQLILASILLAEKSCTSILPKISNDTPEDGIIYTVFIAGSKILRTPTKIVRLILFAVIPQIRRQFNPKYLLS